MKKVFTGLILLILSSSIFAQVDKKGVQNSINKRAKEYEKIAKSIWDWAEMGYQEEKSSNLLKKILSDQEFNIKSGVANIPTAFTASYGSGLPIIAILGEYDALPGLSQKRVPYKISAGGKAGHACGHHLFGTASAAAAIEIKNYLKESMLDFYLQN